MIIYLLKIVKINKYFINLKLYLSPHNIYDLEFSNIRKDF